MKRTILSITTLITLSLFSIFSFSIFAQEVKPSSQSIEDGFSQMFGQEHYYTVVLRGNGEASVHSKFIFSNTEEATTSAMILKTPNIVVKDLVAYQVIREPLCQVYEPVKYVPYNPEMTPTPYVEPKCKEYSDPDYYNQYYYGKTSYKKAKLSVNGDTITIQLPEKVGPQKSASVMLYYHTDGYTQKQMNGVYTYEIRTLKSETPIRQVQVGVMTDSDLQMRSPDSKVEYRTESASMKKLFAVSSDTVGISPNTSASMYYQQIGQGALTKTAYELQPYDSFKVTGSYADSNVKLYSKELGIGLAAGVILLIAIVFFSRKAYHNFRNSKSKSTQSVISPVQPHHSLYTGLLMGALSFISALVLSGHLLLVYLFINSLWNYGNANMPVLLFLFVITLIVFALVLLGPALFMGLKRGIWWGVGTFFSALGWLFIFLCFFILIVMATSRMYYPTPVPYINQTEPSYNME